MLLPTYCIATLAKTKVFVTVSTILTDISKYGTEVSFC